MKVLVLRSAGTNCDRETAHAFERVGASTEFRHVNELLAEPGLLAAYRILALPGGFSYGDDIAGGRVLATELKARVLPELSRFIDDGGLVLGICNGFQVLVKTGLLPGPSGQSVTLTHNTSHRYEDSWVTLEVPTDLCAWTKKGERYFVPIAHAEGRFVADEEVLDSLEANGQVVFRYAGPSVGRAARIHEVPLDELDLLLPGWGWEVHGVAHRYDRAVAFNPWIGYVQLVGPYEAGNDLIGRVQAERLPGSGVLTHELGDRCQRRRGVALVLGRAGAESQKHDQRGGRASSHENLLMLSSSSECHEIGAHT